MKSRDKFPGITPILIGFSLLLIGAAEITALWALAKVILPNLIQSPGLEEVSPAKFSPQIYQLEIVNNHTINTYDHLYHYNLLQNGDL
jgi:hypothetical protein